MISACANTVIATPALVEGRVAAWIGIALVAIAAPVTSLLLRRLRLPGGLLMGGLAVGIALGPGVLGRLAPDTHLLLYQGPPELAAQYQQLVRERAALATAVGATGGNAVDEFARVDAALREARSTWEIAVSRHGEPLRAALVLCAACALLVAGGSGTTLRRARAAPQVLEAVVIAAWGTVVPIAMILAWSLGRSAGNGVDIAVPESLLVAAAVCIGSWRVAGLERLIARTVAADAAPTALLANLFSSIVAVVLVAVALACVTTWLPALLGTATILALPLGHLLPLPAAVRRIGAVVALPVMAALAMIQVEPFLHPSLLTIVLLYLIAEDGRWLAIVGGERLGGHRPWMSAMRMALVPLASGTCMIAVVSVGLANEVLAPDWAGGLLVVAALLELVAPLRLRAARSLRSLEAPATP